MLPGLCDKRKGVCALDVRMGEPGTILNTTQGAAIYSRGMQTEKKQAGQKQRKERERQRLT